MTEQHIDQILLSFERLDQKKIDLIISYDTSHELLNQMIAIFDSEMKAKIDLIKSAISENNFAEVSRLAHQVRSTSLNLGTIRLSEILKRIEYQTLEQQVITSEIDLLITAFEKEYFLASEKINSYVKK